MRPRQDRMSLGLHPSDRASLRQLAEKFGYMRGDQPNVSELIRAIARQELLLLRKSEDHGR